ncbi:MAG: hypothetical protein JSS09_08940 [Verrucomicrobia bacterium]|nr:hypothetical protein [Verrucomicrobiota bacterium]
MVSGINFNMSCTKDIGAAVAAPKVPDGMVCAARVAYNYFARGETSNMEVASVTKKVTGVIVPKISVRGALALFNQFGLRDSNKCWPTTGMASGMALGYMPFQK